MTGFDQPNELWQGLETPPRVDVCQTGLHTVFGTGMSKCLRSVQYRIKKTKQTNESVTFLGTEHGFLLLVVFVWRLPERNFE